MTERASSADDALYALLDPDGSRLLRAGGLLSLVPFVGWPIVLGYRRALVEHFYEATPTALPRWRGRLREHLACGLAAMGVTQVYLSPAWILLGAVMLERGGAPGEALGLLAAASVIAPVVTNVALPIACVVLSTSIGGDPVLAIHEAACVLATFAALTFLLPAAFLRVGWAGRFSAAFRLAAVLRVVSRHPRAYLRAWTTGLGLNAVAVALFPVAPWAITWAYVGSVAAFHRTAAGAPESGEGRVDRGGWLARAEGLARGAGGGCLVRVRGVLVVRSKWLPLPLPTGSLLERGARRLARRCTVG